MDSIRLKTKELQSKMYLTQTLDSDSLTQWTHKSGELLKRVIPANLGIHSCDSSLQVVDGLLLYCTGSSAIVEKYNLQHETQRAQTVQKKRRDQVAEA